MMLILLILITLNQNFLKSSQNIIKPAKPFLINISSSSDFCIQNTIKSKRYNLNCIVKNDIKLKTSKSKTYNIPLLILYDHLLEVQLKDSKKILLNLLKHVHDIYNTYDIINEIGKFNFLILDFLKINSKVQFNTAQQGFDLIENSIQNLQNYSNAISLYITGSIIIYGEKYERILKGFKLEGIANTDTFCGRSPFAITVFDGFNKLTSVIAHELAHVLGVSHDNVFSLCNCDNNSYLMSSSYSKKRYKFSVCSRLQLNQLKNKKKSCFESKNFLFQTKNLKSIKPLSFDEQCKINYSILFQFDENEKHSSLICEKLYCKLGLIKLSNYPVLNNTPCNEEPKMICCFGKCVITCVF